MIVVIVVSAIELLLLLLLGLLFHTTLWKVGFGSVCLVASVMSNRTCYILVGHICTHSHMVAASSNREAMTKQIVEDRSS